MNNDNTPDNNVPEKKSADDAVLDAFAKAHDADEEFRKRWEATVKEANQRREERKAAEEARLRAQAERKARLERMQTPRVSEENGPGVPMDIGRLSAIASEKRTVPAEPAAKIAEKEPEEPEPDDFIYNETAAEKAIKSFGSLRSDVYKESTVRDKTIKKKLGKRIAFFFRTRFSKNGLKAFAQRNFPAKGDDGSEIVRKCIRVVSCIALICALGFLGNYFVDYCRRLSDTNSFEAEINKLGDIDEGDLEDAWAQIRAQYPDIQFPEGMDIRFSKLYAMNQHFVGWLKIDNTRINTALLQADNNSYHLRYNIYDEYSRFGNPFVHYKCNMGKDGLSKNTIVFGHNANDKLMFHDLINYMTVEGYLKSPIVTLDTLYGQTKWKVFAVVLTNSHPSEDNGYVWSYLYPEFNSASHLNRVLGEIEDRTIIHTGVDVNENDQLLTLYTCCTYVLDSGRLAVFARQLRDGESEEIDTARVYYNQSAHYPQTWYDRKGKTNPYADPTEATTEAEQSTTVKPQEQASDVTPPVSEEASAPESVPAEEPVSEAPPEVTEPPADTPPAEETPTEAPSEATAAPET